ncbi:MAG: hypothetical protein R3C02_26005 [Planctomycetaceae bacterium]
MGCRVNGPGETDDADIGLWCGPNFVNLKKGPWNLEHFLTRRFSSTQGRVGCGDCDKVIAN